MVNDDRLISAPRLVTVLAKKSRNGMIHYDDLMTTIADIPTVDAVEVVHGRWEYEIFDIYKCSNCGDCSHVKEVMGKPDWEYCPNCGARMDGDGNG